MKRPVANLPFEVNQISDHTADDPLPHGCYIGIHAIRMAVIYRSAY